MSQGAGDPLNQWDSAPGEWHCFSLWSLAEYLNGRAFKPSDFSSVGLPIVKITELKYGISENTDKYEGPIERKHLLSDEDLLFAWSGNPETSIDSFMWRSGQAVLNQHIFRVVPYSIIDKYYLFYLFKFLRPTFIRTARDKATSMGHVKVTDLKRLIARVPPMAEQVRIVSILRALDDKIEVNRRMNETQEAIGCAIFKSWFVDFDPVHARADGRHPDGLSGSLAAAFPSRLVNSEIGPIPEGWPSKPLPEVIAVNPTRVLDKGSVAPYVDMGNMPTHSARVLGWFDRAFGSGMRFENGDTLVARITPCLENGKTAFVDFLKEKQVGWGSTEFIVLRPKLPLPPEFGYFLARSAEFRAFAVSNMSGTSGRQRVPADCFTSFNVVVPPKTIAIAFGELVTRFFRKMKQNDEESTALELLRDALLSKLVSGEVRIKEAEEIIEAHA